MERSLLRNESSTGAKVPRSECSMERKFHGSESSLYGPKRPGISPDWGNVPQGRLWVESRPRRLRSCGPVPFAVTGASFRIFCGPLCAVAFFLLIHTCIRITDTQVDEVPFTERKYHLTINNIRILHKRPKKLNYIHGTYKYSTNISLKCTPYFANP